MGQHQTGDLTRKHPAPPALPDSRLYSLAHVLAHPDSTDRFQKRCCADPWNLPFSPHTGYSSSMALLFAESR